MEKLETSGIAGRNGAASVRNVLAILQRLGTELPRDLGIYPKELKPMTSQKHGHCSIAYESQEAEITQKVIT